MNSYNHNGVPYQYPPQQPNANPPSSASVGRNSYIPLQQASQHQPGLQAPTPYQYQAVPPLSYTPHDPMQVPAIPPLYLPQAVIHAPSSSPGLLAYERASAPDSPHLRQPSKPKSGSRTSPRSNMGIAGPRVPQTVAQGDAAKKPGKTKSSGGMTQASSVKTKPDIDTKVKEENLTNKQWTDSAVTQIIHYLFGDVIDGDIGEGKWKDWQKNKNHRYQKMSEVLFQGMRPAVSIKSKVERLIKIYKHIVAFEDHTGGGGDGDDDGLSESEKIKKKLESAQAAGLDIGKITVAEIEKWRLLGWYESINNCLGMSQNVRRKTGISSVNPPSPFGGYSSLNAGDDEEAANDDEDREVIVVEDGEEGEESKELDESAESSFASGEVASGEETITQAQSKTAVSKKSEVKREGKKCAGASSTSGVEERPFKKTRPAATSVDPTAFLSANTEYFQSRIEIDKKSLELKEKQYKSSTALEKTKVKLDLAQKILANENLEDEEMAARARRVLMQALEDE